MKRLLCFFTVAAALSAFAGGEYVDPNPFHDYGSAMQHHDGYLMAYEWQRTAAGKIRDATREEVIEGFVDSEETAAALLDGLKGAYATDPVVLTQIAAVTQWVMLPDPWYCLFWNGPHAAGREVWRAALTAKMAASDDEYVRTFCRQQLDLCE